MLLLLLLLHVSQITPENALNIASPLLMPLADYGHAGKASGLLDGEGLDMLGNALAREPPLPPARFVALMHDFAGILQCEQTSECLLAYCL